MGNDTENLMERLEKELEKEKRKRDKRGKWLKRLKLLMIFGAALAFSSVTILAFTKSLYAGFAVMGVACLFPYGLYVFYNES